MLVAALCGVTARDSTAATVFGTKLVPTGIDYGWNGHGHRVPLLQGGGVLLQARQRCDDDLVECTSNADCATGTCASTCDLPPGQCEIYGPLVQARCVRDFTPCTTNADCSTSTCVEFTSPPIPISAANTPACITSYAEGDITGTYDPSSGDSALSATLRWRVHLGITQDAPCPRCGKPADSPEVGDLFKCDGGPRNNQDCTVDAVSEWFGGVSYDCPADVTDNISGPGLRIRLPEITTGTTARTAEIPCVASNICTDDGSFCSTNADCLRCTNDLAPCTTNGDCSSGSCAAAPAQPIACGFYCHCGFCNFDPEKPCFGDTDCDAGESCVDGNSTTGIQDLPNYCEDLVCGRSQNERCCASGDANCPAPTARLGSCSDAPYVECTSNADCAAGQGACAIGRLPCFENTVQRTGAPSPLGSYCTDDPTTGACTSNGDCATGTCDENTAEPTYVALTCLGRTASGAIHASAGIPGPAALTFSAPGGLVQVLCGNDVIDPGEACDGDACCTSACTFEVAGTPCNDDAILCTDDECGAAGACLHPYDASNDPSCTADSDGDGIPDSIDPCQSDPNQSLDDEGERLELRRVNRDGTPGNDALTLKADFLFPTKAIDMDPVATGARILMYASDLSVLSDTVIPPGETWSVEKHEYGGLISEGKFMFKDANGAHNGIRRFRIRAYSPFAVNGVYIKVIGRGGTYPLLESDLPVHVTVIIGDGQISECADGTFAASSCRLGAHGRRITCRP